MSDITGKVIGLFIGAILFASLLPTAITTIVGVNQIGWDAATTTIWDLIPLVLVLVVLMAFLEYYRRH